MPPNPAILVPLKEGAYFKYKIAYKITKIIKTTL